MIIFLGNRIFGGKPQILPLGNRVGKAASGKAFDGALQIVHALYHAALFEVMDSLAQLGSILTGNTLLVQIMAH